MTTENKRPVLIKESKEQDEKDAVYFLKAAMEREIRILQKSSSSLTAKLRHAFYKVSSTDEGPQGILVTLPAQLLGTTCDPSERRVDAMLRLAKVAEEKGVDTSSLKPHLPLLEKFAAETKGLKEDSLRALHRGRKMVRRQP